MPQFKIGEEWLKTGDKVHYITQHDGKAFNGIIQTFVPAYKSLPITEVFVVYDCGGNWDKFQNYTAVRTKIVDLYPGWRKKLNFKMPKTIKHEDNSN